MDTPRRTSASIGKSIDDEIAFLHQFRKTISLGSGPLSRGQDLYSAVTIPEGAAQVVEKFVAISRSNGPNFDLALCRRINDFKQVFLTGSAEAYLASTLELGD